MPGLKDYGLGLTMAHYLFQPVHKVTFAAEKCKGIVDGEVAFKNNFIIKHHIIGHYLLFRIKLRKEIGSHLDKEVTAVSCDTMNKIKINILAVSKYHQIRKIFLQSDQPNYLEHDSPLSYKLIPEGILILGNKEHPVKNVSVITENDSTQARNDLILAKLLSKLQSLERSKAIADHQKELDNNLLTSDLEIKKMSADGVFSF